jgi:hypothetical protein
MLFGNEPYKLSVDSNSNCVVRDATNKKGKSKVDEKPLGLF